MYKVPKELFYIHEDKPDFTYGTPGTIEKFDSSNNTFLLSFICVKKIEDGQLFIEKKEHLPAIIVALIRAYDIKNSNYLIKFFGGALVQFGFCADFLSLKYGDNVNQFKKGTYPWLAENNMWRLNLKSLAKIEKTQFTALTNRFNEFLRFMNTHDSGKLILSDVQKDFNEYLSLLENKFRHNTKQIRIQERNQYKLAVATLFLTLCKTVSKLDRKTLHLLEKKHKLNIPFTVKKYVKAISEYHKAQKWTTTKLFTNRDGQIYNSFNTCKRAQDDIKRKNTVVRYNLSNVLDDE